MGWRDDFAKIKQSMGIPANQPVDFSLDTETVKLRPEHIRPVWYDIDISADDTELTHSSDGRSIQYKGDQVILYIRNQPKTSGGVYKYHLAWCHTLERMHNSQRYDKYVVSNDRDGWFHVNIVQEDKILKSEWIKMLPCKNCLKKLNWKNYKNVSYQEQDKIMRNFSLEEFFNESGGNKNWIHL